MRGIGRVGLLGIAGLVLLGCRTVWVHPEATSDKYDRDLFFCSYGMERSEWTPPAPAEPSTTRSERAWALREKPPPEMLRGDWKSCMLRLGWKTDTGARASKPWSLPREAKRPHGRHP